MLQWLFLLYNICLLCRNMTSLLQVMSVASEKTIMLVKKIFASLSLFIGFISIQYRSQLTLFSIWLICLNQKMVFSMISLPDEKAESCLRKLAQGLMEVEPVVRISSYLLHACTKHEGKLSDLFPHPMGNLSPSMCIWRKKQCGEKSLF